MFTAILQTVTLCWLLLATVAFAGVHPGTIMFLLGGVLLTLLAACHHKKLHFRLPGPLLWAFLLLLGVLFLQLLPWPASLVALLAPHSYDLLHYLLTPLPGTPLSAWLPAVLTPGQTLFSAGRLLLLFCYLLLLVALFSKHSHRRSWPLWFLGGLGTFSVIISLVAALIAPGAIVSLYPHGAISDAIFPASFINSNFQAGFYILSAFSSLAVAGYHNIRHEGRIAAIVMALFGLLGVALTASRGAIICLIAGLLLFAIINWRTLGRRGLVLLTGAVAVAVALSSYLAASRLSQQLATLKSANFSWQEEKLGNWPVFANIVKDFWLFGSGEGSLAAIFPQYGQHDGGIITAAESLLFDLPLKFGLPATFILMFLLIILCRQFSKCRRFYLSEWAAVCGLLTWLLQNLVDFNWRSPAIMMGVAILLATIITAEHRHNTAHWYHLKRWQLVIVTTLILLWFVPAINARPALPGQYDRALRSAVTESDFPAAQNIFQKCQFWAPADSYSYTLFGWLLSAQKNPAAARQSIHYLNRALFLDNSSWMADFASGRALFTLQQEAQARIQIKTAMEIAPESDKKILIQTLDREKGGRRLLLSLGIDAAPSTQHQLLLYFYSINDIPALQQAIDTFAFVQNSATPANLQLAFKVGQRLKNLDYMHETCQKTSRLFPEDFFARLCPALLQAESGQNQEAIAALQDLLATATNVSGRQIVPHLLQLYYREKDIDGLSALLTNHFASDHLADIYYHRGLLLLARKDGARASRDFEFAVNINPESFAWFYLGQRREAIGQLAGAKQAYQKVLQAHPDHRPSQEALLRLETIDDNKNR